MEGGLAGDGKEVSGPGCPNMEPSEPDEPNPESARPKETRHAPAVINSLFDLKI